MLHLRTAEELSSFLGIAVFIVSTTCIFGCFLASELTTSRISPVSNMHFSYFSFYFPASFPSTPLAPNISPICAFEVEKSLHQLFTRDCTSRRRRSSSSSTTSKGVINFTRKSCSRTASTFPFHKAPPGFSSSVLSICVFSCASRLLSRFSLCTFS